MGLLSFWGESRLGAVNLTVPVSALFNEKVLSGSVATTELRYRKALFHLLTSQTSCYRYWSQGIWTDYGREICRRAKDILGYDFD